MRFRTQLSLTLCIFGLPLTAFAYQVPERDYWRAFTLSLINTSREEHGLEPLGLDSTLNELSQTHANDSATHYDDASNESRRATYIIHVSSDGRTLGDRARDQGISAASRFGENVGLRFRSAFADVHAAIEEGISYMHEYMMAEVPPDDGHRVTILTPEYTHVGIGLELHRKAGDEPNTIFLVTDFAAFTDGREVVIPKIGKRPELVVVHPLSPSVPLRTRRVRERTFDRLTRRAIVPVTLSPVEPAVNAPSPSSGTTLRERVEMRRLQRLRVRF